MGKVERKDFDRNLAKILTCYDADEVYTSERDSTYSLSLNPNYGFIWDKERVENVPIEEGSYPLQGG